MVNVTNLTSSFRSGIAFAVILKKLVPESIELNQLDPRLAKGNLKTVLSAYKQAGLDWVEFIIYRYLVDNRIRFFHSIDKDVFQDIRILRKDMQTMCLCQHSSISFLRL